MANEKFALGLLYEMELELTELIPVDQSGKPSVNEKVFLDKVELSYIDNGEIDVVLVNNITGVEEVRTVRSDFGTPLGGLPFGTNFTLTEVITETGRRQVFSRCRAENFHVKLRTKTHLNTRIAAISQTGTIIPQV